MAVEMAPAVLHLMEAATGRTVARLEDPNGDRAIWQGFTPDGARLVVVAKYAAAIHVWDLRAIRARLQEMSLDWDWPDLPPAAPAPAPPVTIQVDAGDPALAARAREQKARQYIARYRREIAASGKDARAHNNLAWVYLTAPESLRDVKEAVRLAEIAAQLEPGNAIYRNTLGMAYYRAGRYREAVDVLRPNIEKAADWALALDLYVLAMSYHRLGETARARDYYDWAVRWVAARQDLKPDTLDELADFRAEADKVLEAP
jgi:tetratricopeptide (TPR) repeat protein